MADFHNSFIIVFSETFAIKYCYVSRQKFTLYLHYLAKQNDTFIILPLQLLQKVTLKFKYFLLNVIHII